MPEGDMLMMPISLNIRQKTADMAVVMPTVLNPGVLRAARSVFAQESLESLHLLIGVDLPQGDVSLLDTIRAECPSHVMLTILDLGYSTAIRHGGTHRNAYSGALRSILSFAANSRFVATLDDNDWYAPMHLALMREAIAGREWAFSHRWLVDPATNWPICVDEWDAVGPGRGINQDYYGGFVHPSALMVDMETCRGMIHAWSDSPFPDGSGEDRLVFEALRKRPFGESEHATVFCTLNDRSIHDAHHVTAFAARGISWPQSPDLIAQCRAELRNAGTALTNGAFDQALAACETVRMINAFLPDNLLLESQALTGLGRIEEAAIKQAQAQLLFCGQS